METKDANRDVDPGSTLAALFPIFPRGISIRLDEV